MRSSRADLDGFGVVRMAAVDTAPDRAIEVVQRFVVGLHDIRARVLADMPELTCLYDLRRRAWAGDVPRKGWTASGIIYRCHGIGCRFTDATHGTVDVDFLPDPVVPDGYVEAFDAWRLRWFNDDRVAVSLDELRAACTELTRRGELRVIEKQGFYASV